MASRPRAWADFIVSLNLTTGTEQSVNLLTNAPSLDTITVGRLIGTLYAQAESLTAQIDGSQSISVGIGVASSDAFNAAANVGLPSPAVSSDAPARGWLYRTNMVVTKVHSTGTTYELAWNDKTHFDVRAMRRVDKGVCFLIVQSSTLIGTAFNVRLTGLIRAMCLT